MPPSNQSLRLWPVCRPASLPGAGRCYFMAAISATATARPMRARIASRKLSAAASGQRITVITENQESRRINGLENRRHLCAGGRL
jgi:hypothetical protein